MVAFRVDFLYNQSNSLCADRPAGDECTQDAGRIENGRITDAFTFGNRFKLH